jgi:hypothetical protein
MAVEVVVVIRTKQEMVLLAVQVVVQTTQLVKALSLERETRQALHPHKEIMVETDSLLQEITITAVEVVEQAQLVVQQSVLKVVMAVQGHHHQSLALL